MYTLANYGKMLADRQRTDSYLRALERTVRQGSVVLEIGTGIGVFAVVACRLGARRVYAIESNDAIQVAREVAAANGCGDRIEFVQARSLDVELPERADVLLSDLRGVLPLYALNIPSVADARKRLLKPDAIIIPQSDRIWAAVVEAGDAWHEDFAPWDDSGTGVDLSPARRLVENTNRKVYLEGRQLLGAPQLWARLDYRTVEEPNAYGTVCWQIEQQGTAHGLALWFDSCLAQDVSFSNAPNLPPMVYGVAFFPWPTPVQLAPGDRVTTGIRAQLINGEYLWFWDSDIRDKSGAVKAEFKQSTFHSVPMSPQQIHKRGDNYVPTPNRAAEIEAFVLERFDGKTPVGEIARRLHDKFPESFRTLQDALNEVGELSTRFSR